MTEAEKRLWRGLRELGGPVRFRRQHPIGTSIVDFAFPSAKLAIELDGGQHAMQGAHDDARSMEITARGYRVIRFWNGEVMENLAGVLETIRRELTISLSAPGGGEGRGEVGDFAPPQGPPHPPHR
jgi:very-short-patch-repair endonuclease